MPMYALIFPRDIKSLEEKEVYPSEEAENAECARSLQLVFSARLK